MPCLCRLGCRLTTGFAGWSWTWVWWKGLGMWRLGSSTWEGESFGQKRKNIDGHGCLPSAGVHRSLQAPGTWSSPGEAGHWSRGHWEDHLGLLDKVTAGKVPGETTLVPASASSLCGAGIWSSSETELFPLAQEKEASSSQIGPQALIWPRLLKCKVPLDVSHPSPAPPNKFKGKPSPRSWPSPLQDSEAFSNPWDGREGWSPGSRVSSRALPSQKRGDHQPGSLKEPPLFNQTHTYSEALWGEPKMEGTYLLGWKGPEAENSRSWGKCTEKGVGGGRTEEPRDCTDSSSPPGRGCLTAGSLVTHLTPLPVGTAFWETKSLASGREMQTRLTSTAPVWPTQGWTSSRETTLGWWSSLIFRAQRNLWVSLRVIPYTASRLFDVVHSPGDCGHMDTTIYNLAQEESCHSPGETWPPLTFSSSSQGEVLEARRMGVRVPSRARVRQEASEGLAPRDVQT